MLHGKNLDLYQYMDLSYFLRTFYTCLSFKDRRNNLRQTASWKLYQLQIKEPYYVFVNCEFWHLAGRHIIQKFKIFTAKHLKLYLIAKEPVRNSSYTVMECQIIKKLRKLLIENFMSVKHIPPVFKNIYNINTFSLNEFESATEFRHAIRLHPFLW